MWCVAWEKKALKLRLAPKHVLIPSIYWTPCCCSPTSNEKTILCWSAAGLVKSSTGPPFFLTQAHEIDWMQTKLNWSAYQRDLSVVSITRKVCWNAVLNPVPAAQAPHPQLDFFWWHWWPCLFRCKLIFIMLLFAVAAVYYKIPIFFRFCFWVAQKLYSLLQVDI